jgi:hypothetical protein
MSNFTISIGFPQNWPNGRTTGYNPSMPTASSGWGNFPPPPPSMGFDQFDWHGFGYDPYFNQGFNQPAETLISGDKGTKTPQLGWFGANAFANAQQATGPTTVQYTTNFGQKDNPNLSSYYDAFSYAQAAIKDIDTNQDGKVNLQELSQGLGSRSLAQNHLRAFDTNNSRSLDLSEAAARILLEDYADGLDGKITQATHDQLILDLSDPRHGAANAAFYREQAAEIQQQQESAKPDYGVQRTYSQILRDFKANKIYEPTNAAIPPGLEDPYYTGPWPNGRDPYAIGNQDDIGGPYYTGPWPNGRDPYAIGNQDDIGGPYYTGPWPNGRDPYAIGNRNGLQLVDNNPQAGSQPIIGKLVDLIGLVLGGGSRTTSPIGLSRLPIDQYHTDAYGS